MDTHDDLHPKTRFSFQCKKWATQAKGTKMRMEFRSWRNATKLHKPRAVAQRESVNSNTTYMSLSRCSPRSQTIPESVAPVLDGLFQSAWPKISFRSRLRCELFWKYVLRGGDSQNEANADEGSEDEKSLGGGSAVEFLGWIHAMWLYRLGLLWCR